VVHRLSEPSPQSVHVGPPLNAVPSFVDVQSYTSECAALIEEALRTHVAEEFGPHDVFGAPLAYVLNARGKRLRPLLALLSCELMGGERHWALDAACAVECFHASSLILDDLPCMDDAALRRGIPSLHREFGEATAVLVALVLFNLGHRLLARRAHGDGHWNRAAHERVAGLLGAHGVMGGQAFDLAIGSPTRKLESADELRLLKTSALFAASAFAGGCAAGADESKLELLAAFGAAFGMVFQFLDDELDARDDQRATVPLSAARRGELCLSLRVAVDKLESSPSWPGTAALVLRGMVSELLEATESRNEASGAD
jgi:geranylgeranyl pyrophosphate synthase